MNNTQQIQKAQAENARNLKLWTAATDLESATALARKARLDLQRATRNRLTAKERHADADGAWKEAGEPGTDQDAILWSRVITSRWILEDAVQAEEDALEDYRNALARVEAVGTIAGEGDSHDVPAHVRHRVRKAIALADAFGNKVTMDGTLFDGLERPRLPELEPEVEVQEFAVIDPLEPVEAWTPPETPRAVLVPVDDYSRPEDWEDAIPEDLRPTDEDPAAGGWKPEHMSPEWWKQVTYSAPLNVKDPLPATDEDENLAPVCPECRSGKHCNCDGTAWDDHEDAPASCSCLTCEAKNRENGEAGR